MGVCVCKCVCAEGLGIEGRGGRSLCALNVLGDAKIQSGPLEAKDKGWVGSVTLEQK